MLNLKKLKAFVHIYCELWGGGGYVHEDYYSCIIVITEQNEFLSPLM